MESDYSYASRNTESIERILKKVMEKRDFSKLREIDVKMAFEHFRKRQVSDEEKIRLTRDLLRKIFSAFTSQKILSPKNKDFEWILRKHLSTRERLPFYKEVYERIFRKIRKATVIDLGAGINGFSYPFFEELGFDVSYLGVESVGQLVDLMNDYFKKNGKNARAVHLSLFELEKLKKETKKTERPRLIFLLKTLDSLEMMEKNYSKKLLLEISSIADSFVVSFATRSMIKRTKFKVNREWILNFIGDNFSVSDDFEVGNERYIIFTKK